MGASPLSPIETDQRRMVELSNAVYKEVTDILSAQSPSLLYEAEKKKKLESYREKVKFCCQLPDESSEPELDKLVTVALQWRDYKKQHGRDTLERKDAEYINNLIHKLKEQYERAIVFCDALTRPISESYPKQPAPPSDSPEEGRSRHLQIETRIEAENNERAEPLNHGPDPLPSTPGPNQSPVSNKRTWVTTLEQPTSPRVTSTIDFQELYQDGKGTPKYSIIDIFHTLSSEPTISGRWWILRCDECGWHGANKTNRTTYEAGVHLKNHHQFKGDGDFATIDALGVLVLNCNPELARKNNDEVRKALTDGSYERKNTQVQHKKKKRKLVKVAVPPRASRELPIITDPYVGKLYLAHWPDGNVYGVVVVPLGDFGSRVGIPGSIHDPEVFKTLPNCYCFDPQNKTFSWAEGYEDGGMKMTKRRFPLFYFDSLAAETGHVGWGYADDMEQFDMEKVTPEYRKHAEEYIKDHMSGNYDFKPFSYELSPQDQHRFDGEPKEGRSSDIIDENQENHDSLATSTSSRVATVAQNCQNLNEKAKTPTTERGPMNHASTSGIEATSRPDISGSNPPHPERVPSPHFYMPPELNEEREPSPTGSRPAQPEQLGEKVPEANMDLGSRPSDTTSAAAVTFSQRPAANIVLDTLDESAQEQNASGSAPNIPSGNGNERMAQDHGHDQGLNQYIFIEDDSNFSVSTPDIFTIHGLYKPILDCRDDGQEMT